MIYIHSADIHPVFQTPDQREVAVRRLPSSHWLCVTPPRPLTNNMAPRGLWTNHCQEYAQRLSAQLIFNNHFHSLLIRSRLCCFTIKGHSLSEGSHVTGVRSDWLKQTEVLFLELEEHDRSSAASIKPCYFSPTSGEKREKETDESSLGLKEKQKDWTHFIIQWHFTFTFIFTSCPNWGCE